MPSLSVPVCGPPPPSPPLQAASAATVARAMSFGARRANVVGDSYVRLETGGEECEMRVPSGDQTGLKLVRGFTVGAGTITDFTIDFDLR